MRESKFYMILCIVHTLIVGSLWLFITNIVTLGLFMIPSFCAGFTMAKEMIYKDFDYHGSVTRRYFQLVAQNLKLMKYCYLNIMILINLVGIFLGIYTGMTVIAYLSLMIVASLMTFIGYLSGYYTFIDENFTLSEAAVFMFYKPVSMLMLISLHLLFLLFLNNMLVFVFAFGGAGILYAIALVVCSQSLMFKKRFNLLHEEDLRFKIGA